MKKLQIILLLIAMLSAGIVVNSFGQDHPRTDHPVFIDAKGGIHNHGGTRLGYIDKNNIVRDNQGKKIYFIDDKGNVIDAQGKILGKANKNGDYFNINGETVFRTKDIDQARCAILNPQGHNFGTVHKNYKLHACAAHCFFLEQQKKKAGIKKS